MAGLLMTGSTVVLLLLYFTSAINIGINDANKATLRKHFVHYRKFGHSLLFKFEID